MSDNHKIYLIETIGTDTTVRIAELLGLDPGDRQTIYVRGKPRIVSLIPALEIEKVISSQDHRDNVRVYLKEDENEPRLVWPKRRL